MPWSLPLPRQVPWVLGNDELFNAISATAFSPVKSSLFPLSLCDSELESMNAAAQLEGRRPRPAAAVGRNASCSIPFLASLSSLSLSPLSLPDAQAPLRRLGRRWRRLRLRVLEHFLQRYSDEFSFVKVTQIVIPSVNLITVTDNRCEPTERREARL